MLRDVADNGLAAVPDRHVLHGDGGLAVAPMAVERLDLGGKRAREPDPCIREMTDRKACLRCTVAAHTTNGKKQANLWLAGRRAAGCRVRLARTFPAQIEALNRYRSHGEPAITVQNVSVGDGGKAIVGNVTQHARVIVSDKKPPSAARNAPKAAGSRRGHGPAAARREAQA